MTKGLTRMSFDEFSADLNGIFDRIVSEGDEILVERENGELVALSPVVSTISRPKTEKDYEAFRASAGSWADVDTDAFLKDIHESRKSSRPPIKL